ncbi:MAG TPA: hypothetical protein VJ044_12740, partial [Candidatus Hodarchaeales archaeon]|nr:hypothetical protein [Candidatus Hodarchaeales archaeon]
MATNEIRILINAINRSSGAFKQAHGDVDSLAMQVAKAGAIIAGFGAITKVAFDFAEEGAQIQRLRDTGQQLAQTFGIDMADAVARIKAASHDTITANRAVMEANRAMLLGVAHDVDTLAKLVEIATIRGRAAGLSATDAFDRITLGIGRLSTRILDDIGIVVDGETAYAKYGEAIGKTADQLTEAEKRIALTNAIIEDGNKLLEQTGGIVDDNAQAFERFKTHITDAKNEFEKFLAGPIAEFIGGVDAWVFGMGQIESAILRQARALALSNTPQEDYLDEMVRMVEQANLFAQAASLPIRYDIDKDGQLVKTELGISTVIDKNYVMLEQERAIAQTEEQVTQVRKDHTRALEEQRLAQEALIKTQADAIKGLEGLRIKIEDLDMEKAGKIALDFFKDFGVSEENLTSFERLLTTNLGTMSESLEKFIFSLEDAAADGKVTWDEFLSAFDVVKLEQAAQRTIELWEEVDDKIRDLRDKFRQDILDSERQLTDDMEDAATKRDRDLADLEEENNRRRDEAIADANKKRQRDEEDAESAHQRRIQKILDKYNRARLQALIDLDARALFEAELTRDQELKDAELDRRERKEQAEKELKDKIEDIEDNYEEKRREILRQYDRDIEDAKEADRRRKRDLERALDEQIAEQERYRQEEMRNIEQFLSDRWSKEQTDYEQRLTDLIQYWQEVMFINELYRGLINNSPIPTADP